MGSEPGILMLALCAIVLCTGHLCVGLALGWFMGRKVGLIRVGGTPASSQPPAPLNVAPMFTSVERLRTDLGELDRLSRQHETSAPREIGELIARLVESLDELHRSLSEAKKASPAQDGISPQPPATEPEKEKRGTEPTGHRMGTHAVSNGRILEWFAGRTIRRKIPGDTRRYPFAVKQLLAMRRGEALPDPAALQTVQCHDLSPSEIRYIADDRPKGEELVIGLGLPRPVKFLLARIEDYRSVYMYGRVGYLVTAQFVAPITDEVYRECLADAASVANEVSALPEGS